MNITLKELGKRCKQYRKSIGLYQIHAAMDTGYSSMNISAFETGRNDNSLILLWYFSKGMTIDDIKDDSENGKIK